MKWWPFFSLIFRFEMQIFCWFSFLNFPLFQFSPSPFLGSVSTFKTLMCGHLCVMIFLYFTWKTGQNVNFPLIQFSEFSIGSVFPITHPRFGLNVQNIYAWTFMCGDLSAHLCVAVVNRLGDSDESPNICNCSSSTRTVIMPVPWSNWMKYLPLNPIWTSSHNFRISFWCFRCLRRKYNTGYGIRCWGWLQ